MQNLIVIYFWNIVNQRLFMTECLLDISVSMTKIKFLTELNISGVGKNDIQILKITSKGLMLGG